ncbi:hypothetical protein EV2_019601 [Malus domestica]
MAPKSRPACEFGDGIITLRRRLNGLHHPWAGLNLSIFFEEEEIHSLRLLGLPEFLLRWKTTCPLPTGSLIILTLLRLEFLLQNSPTSRGVSY